MLKIKDMSQKWSVYPTISMIINGLIENLYKSAYYFQKLSLWKCLKAAPNTEQPHDVIDQKWFSMKTEKYGLLFSIRYPQRSDGIKPESHDVFDQKWFSVKAEKYGLLFSIIYLQQKDGSEPETHDVYGGQRLSKKGQNPAIFYVIEKRTRSVLAPKRRLSKPTMCMKHRGLFRDGFPRFTARSALA
jgi:hypothetical protein